MAKPQLTSINAMHGTGKVVNHKGLPCRQKRNKNGQTLVEYALILAFISVVAISVLIRLGNEVKLVFTTITSQLAVAGSSH
jgi:Flp pilus assembly pilin Flp